MSIVVEVIAEHLLFNRRLVVPAFGAFMVKESGERVFSDLLRNDDGVLASLLRGRGLNEMEAAVMIDRFIFEVRNELEQFGYCRLGDIGTLRVEPTTKALRLYPPVQGEIPKSKPYIPQPAVEEAREVKTEVREAIDERVPIEKKEVKSAPTSNISNTPNISKKVAKPRKKFDFVIVAAIVIVTIALIAIGYGYYVSTLADCDDDAAMDALRVTPEQTIN